MRPGLDPVTASGQGPESNIVVGAALMRPGLNPVAGCGIQYSRRGRIDAARVKSRYGIRPGAHECAPYGYRG